MRLMKTLMAAAAVLAVTATTALSANIAVIGGSNAADFKKGERTREEITDLMAGGETIANLEAEIEANSAH